MRNCPASGRAPLAAGWKLDGHQLFREKEEAKHEGSDFVDFLAEEAWRAGLQVCHRLAGFGACQWPGYFPALEEELIGTATYILSSPMLGERSWSGTALPVAGTVGETDHVSGRGAEIQVVGSEILVEVRGSPRWILRKCCAGG